MSGNLTGDYHVRVFGPALREANHWWPKTKDRMIIRRHALKLRFWPSKAPTCDQGVLLDLDWSWIKALRGLDVGELRVHDRIGGHANIRIIFFVTSAKSSLLPMPVIWTLAAFPKKRDEFTDAQIKIFRLRRKLILERFPMQA